VTARALALDLGTTRVKLATLDDSGTLTELRTTAAPEPGGEGALRELVADDYRRAAESLLEGAPGGLALGIASQRSSFCLWTRDGVPVTPLISWQDRRAATWCDAHRAAEPRVTALTGLPLSAHYAGPKLAHLLDTDSGLGARLASGELLFGTLESYLIWHWSVGRAHETDLSMAARTLLVDTTTGEWSDELLALFGVPRACLPQIAPTFARATPLARGGVLSASLADQPAGLLAVLGTSADGALVNLGTGAFVLSPSGAVRAERRGYLSGPLCAAPATGTAFALEGTINGGGATADRTAAGPTDLPEGDPTPDAFCLPDENGLGAPFWRPRQAFLLDSGGAPLAPADARRVILEGLVFRVRGIVDELPGTDPLFLSGGLAHEPFVPVALATCLEREIHVLEEQETTLLGAARLAAGMEPCARPRTRTARRDPRGLWLRDKYERWREWLARRLD
jgi:glycerol kinase